jgi:hypothetical protein
MGRNSIAINKRYDIPIRLDGGRALQLELSPVRGNEENDLDDSRS